MGDRTIGMASTRLDTIPTGFVLEDMLSMDVPALGRMHRAVATTHIELGRALDLKRFSFALQSAVGRFEVTGHATPDSLLELEIRPGGAPERSRVRLDPDLHDGRAAGDPARGGGQSRWDARSRGGCSTRR